MRNRHILKKGRNIFYAHAGTLRSSDASLGVEPAADNNVMKITDDCLFVRSAFGSLYGGRRSMSWWAIIILVFIYFFFSAFILYGVSLEIKKYGYVSTSSEEICAVMMIAYVAPLILSSWPIIPWRRQLPVIFNRKTREVTCIIQGKCVNESWERLEAHIKDVTILAVGGAPTNEGVLTLVFPYTDPEQPHADGRLRVGITATQDDRQALINRGIYGAAQIWEYIRLYMREGASALPPTCALAPYRISHARDAVRQFNPLKILKVQHPAWLLFAVPFFLFVALPVAPLLMLGDILYMWLDRILPRRKWPKELVEACDGVWDGREG